MDPNLDEPGQSVLILEGSSYPVEQFNLRVDYCPPPSPMFTGREDILNQMESYFWKFAPLERHLFILHGPGGAGKTQLALKFIHAHKYMFWNVFFVDATSRETISAGLTALVETDEASETPSGALAWLVSQKKRWLIVFDNANDPRLDLHEYFPLCTHGDILITTRNEQMLAQAQEPGSHCHVGGMQPNDALQLLLKTVGGEAGEDTVSIAETLVKELGNCALAIVQSGAYMRATHCGLTEYVKTFQTARTRLLLESSMNQADDNSSSLCALWDIIYQQLSPNATLLLRMMSFLHHEGISEVLFEVASTRAMSYEPEIPLTEVQAATKTVVFDFLSSLKSVSGEWDPLAFKNLTLTLRAFSLLDYDSDSGSYSMPPLIQEWCRATTPDAATVRECAAWVLSLCVNMEFSSEDYTFRHQLLPQLLALDLNDMQMVPELANRLHSVYSEAGYAKEDGELITIALQASRDALGTEQPTTLTCMNNLAAAFLRQGRLAEAEALQVEVIEATKRVHGHKHPEMLSSIYNLALTYHNQKRWQEAEALFLEVIEAMKPVIGVEHKNTLMSMGMLAFTYWGQGRLSEAEALQIEVLDTAQRVLGREHPDALQHMYNLAATYETQGKLRKAQVLMKQTVNLRKKVLGELHVDTQKGVQYHEMILQRIQSELGLSSVP
ncbi:TPR-like protein [Ceratobasidium sp. AG-I]|nr:TPR-like protein [Ceratobasidium sp. AG-I]